LSKHIDATLTVTDEQGSPKSITPDHPAPCVGNNTWASMNVEIVSFPAISERWILYPTLSTCSPGSQKANAPIAPVSQGQKWTSL
jgi:hypothetical protein